MFSTGDLLPQQSGSASVGVNFRNGAPTNTLLPYNNIHFISGVIHDPVYGGSGVIRYSQNHGGMVITNPFGNIRGIEISHNGGQDFSLKLGSVFSSFDGTGPHAIISSKAQADCDLYLLSSGNLDQRAQDSILLKAVQSILINANGDIGLTNGNGMGVGGSISLESVNNINETATDDIVLIAGVAAPTVGEGGQISLRAFASSGRLEYRFGPHQAWYEKLSHSNTGGPFNDGFWPIAHSGQVAQMIALAGSTGPVDLDDAYENGNEINQNTRALPPGTSDLVIGQVPVLIKQVTPGAGHGEGNPTLLDGRVTAAIIASGYSLTPNLPNTFAYSALGPGYMHLQASGTASTAPKSFQMGLGNVGAITEGLGILTTDAALIINAPSMHIHTEGGDGDIELHAEGTPGLGIGGQISLEPFSSSGALEFRFGPHQAWYSKVTHSNTGGPNNDGYWPLPHSGQILQMISDNAGPGGTVDLQEAYDNGNEIDHRKDIVGYKGIVIRETTPGLGGFLSNADIATNKSGKYGIAVSGHTLTPTDVNSYGFSALNSLSLVIASSGTPSALSRNFFLGYAPTIANIVFFNTNGTLSFTVAEQIAFNAFASSGRLDYRFGPHQGWAAKLSHSSTGGPVNDGFWPLPHSGQILEMIARTPKSKAITIERPALNNDLTVWYTNERIVVTEVESVVRGTFDASGSFAIRYGSDRSLAGTSITTLPISCANRTTGQITTSFESATIPADNWVWVGVSGVSGVATSQLNITMQYLN